MDRVEVENEHCVLRNVHPVVYKVFGGKVRRRRPKRRMDTLYLINRQTSLRIEPRNRPNFAAYLLDDGPGVREVLLVFCTRPSISAEHAVKLRMGASLNFWVRRDESQEPQDNTGSL
jgi:hypothetical protein